MNCETFEEASGYCGAMGKRMPSAVEWIRAAHGGERATPYPWGESSSGNEACASTNGRRDALGTCVVGDHTTGSSGLGVQDLAGNVSEWTDDATTGKKYVGGGSWRDVDLAFGRDLAGHLLTPIAEMPGDRRASTVGFRCASTPPPR
jgi:formylglycine-generating enzyme required for sulfatase activity